MLKLSVKGSQDGGWGLTQSYLSNEIRADCHGAADRWLARHTFQTAICLVQFADVPDDELPRMYLAWPAEVAAQLRNASRGRGDTILWEDHLHGPRAFAAGTRDRLPDDWRLTRRRAETMAAKDGRD
ncbi:hypothetical protein [Sphingomonas sp.]|uniref:hypothetical protein n=1 Tax=Sphingomonas sp. TaxID=28214 RepID=UPI003CC633D4